MQIIINKQVTPNIETLITDVLDTVITQKHLTLNKCGKLDVFRDDDHTNINAIDHDGTLITDIILAITNNKSGYIKIQIDSRDIVDENGKTLRWENNFIEILEDILNKTDHQFLIIKPTIKLVGKYINMGKTITLENIYKDTHIHQTKGEINYE